MSGKQGEIKQEGDFGYNTEGLRFKGRDLYIIHQAMSRTGKFLSGVRP